MNFVEPAFETTGELWPALPSVPHADVSALNDKLVRQSAELKLRLTEILELYNV
jgi:hypothetical protein